MLGARTLLWLAALGSLASVSLYGQIPSDLQQAMRDRRQAVTQADAATWERLTTDDFTLVAPDGKLVTKAERLAILKQQKPQAPPTMQQEAVKVYGDAAVERVRADSFYIMVVWVKQAQGWRAAAAQFTKVAHQ
jgi:hypothetical protein